MLVGVPKEIKNREYRVGLTPASVREVVAHGHQVVVENNAGSEIGYSNDQYVNAGARILAEAQEVFASADMIVKVKEPQPIETDMLRAGQVIFTYLHLAADLEQTKGLMLSGAVAIAYETVTDDNGGLPLLTPMSEVAGRLSIQAGAHALEMSRGGRGVLIGGAPGVAPATVTIIGGGVVGTNAARMAIGLGANVTIIDRSLARLRQLDDLFQGLISTAYATHERIEEEVLRSDLVIGAVLVAGTAAPKLVSRDLISRMKTGAALVDVAIDQGGCFETSRPTTHEDPVYIVDGVVHYCVANMPGAVALTSTLALNNATLPHVLTIANKGWKHALKADGHLLSGLNVCKGKVTYKAVADAFGLEYTPVEKML